MENILADVPAEDFVYSCIPDDGEIMVGGITEKGVWKAFKEKKYNQLEIDSFSCFMVAPFQAIANFTGKDISYDLMKSTFDKLKKDKKFTPGIGGKYDDGVEYAVSAYNSLNGDTLKWKKVPLTVGTIIEALKGGSPMITFIRYSKTYFADEQDDGDAWINNVDSIGDKGHCIQIIKINTQGDILVKYLENYTGKVKFDIIGVDFDKFRKLFGPNGIYIYR